eukprot:TRINITY_DN131_c0_g1_i1.p1 TRINITY_DN131_c0_g1~~TRINITY_DN131_c0_g1_i1.p1  ORF type:complete len:345 (+),score=95.23 TRINITY_DN131_c0_g1_i1:42-1037(+)
MMKIALIVALFGLALGSLNSERMYQREFAKWMHKHSRAYAADEFQQRYAIFKDNFDFVTQWNADSSHTHQVGLNVFADISNEEYQSIYLGSVIDATERLANAKPSATLNLPNQPADNGDIVNWVNKGAVTPVKDQGQCGSCWSFSTTGSIEGIHEISTGDLIALSEQQLCDCSSSYGNNGCSGGLVDQGFQYVIAVGGLESEADYPYSANNGTCEFDASKIVAKISSYSDVTSGDENALANAANNQPVAVAIDASQQSFQLYTSGVYNEQNCSSTNLDHAVLVVGYGTSSSDYWIVKNSWGPSWGMQGYIQMSRNANNQCGIATQASVPQE